MKSDHTDIIIIGGGLAGLTAAIHLTRAGHSVRLIEKNAYPKHKVCGEYISNEVLPYLQQLDADPLSKGAKKLSRLQLSTVSGKTVEARLPLGGFSISRYTLDHFLYLKAVEQGCDVVQATVTDVSFENDVFTVATRDDRYRCRVAIGAYGKRSNMDIRLDRPFIKKRSPFVAVKTHLRGEFPDDLVALHNFRGGYCGVSMVENGNLNVCYLADHESFRRYRSIPAFQEAVVYRNPHLKKVFRNSEPVFDQPLTISQVSFFDKSTVEDHMLMCGDAAGMIHPLCGNGMAMAIHGAKIASEQVIRYLNGGIRSREEMESGYTEIWRQAFSKRIRTGRILQEFFGRESIASFLLFGATHIPGILPTIIRKTHGRPIKLETA